MILLSCARLPQPEGTLSKPNAIDVEQSLFREIFTYKHILWTYNFCFNNFCIFLREIFTQC